MLTAVLNDFCAACDGFKQTIKKFEADRRRRPFFREQIGFSMKSRKLKNYFQRWPFFREQLVWKVVN